MILYILKQNNNEDSPAFGKWYAYPLIEECVDLDGLAEHMSNHNTPFSKGAIKGVLADMVSCIKELLLEGKNVKIADLAIFSLGIKNVPGGAETEKDFSVLKNVQGVRLRARATGELIAKSLNLVASLKRATATTKTASNGSADPTGGDNGTTDSGSNGSNSSNGSRGSSSETVRLAVSAGQGGQVKIGDGAFGAGSNIDVAAGTSVSIAAQASEGYTFSQWSDGNTNASRNVTVNSAMTLTASFTTSGGGGNTGDGPSE